jgi:hypothetical protein
MILNSLLNFDEELCQDQAYTIVSLESITHAFPADPQISIHLTVKSATFWIPSSIN